MQPDLCGLPSICGHQMVLCNQLRATQHPPVPAHPKTASSAMHRVPHYRQLKDPALGQPTGQSHPGDSPTLCQAPAATASCLLTKSLPEQALENPRGVLGGVRGDSPHRGCAGTCCGMALQGPTAPAQALGRSHSVSTGAVFLLEPSWSRLGLGTSCMAEQGCSHLAGGGGDHTGWISRTSWFCGHGARRCREWATGADTGLEKLGFWQQDLKQL